MDNEIEESNERLDKDALRHVSTINDEDLKLGIPSKWFYGGAAMSLILGVAVLWYIGILFALVYFLTMHSIHEDDPKALDGWLRLLMPGHKDRWIGGEHVVRQVVFIDKEER
ncbi:hypothetical protein ACHMW6_00195 (plasmid) [Pseudoduganella sp. UC29_106]|uniref:hypothetical protein n=1 Tax=Pseudoduganella sp. UC29_106 TaxID=3374553 RepID=UPI003756D28F